MVMFAALAAGRRLTATITPVESSDTDPATKAGGSLSLSLSLSLSPPPHAMPVAAVLK